MSFINVCIKKDNNMTAVSNDFIKNYMPKANSAYVKIYLYMLMLSSSNETIDIENVAKSLDVFESEIIKVLTSLSKEGYCTFKKDGDNFSFSPDTTEKNLKSEIAFPKISEKMSFALEDHPTTIEVKLPLTDTSFVEQVYDNDIKVTATDIENEELKTAKTSYSPDELALVLECNDDIKDVMSFIEKNYGCTFSPSNLESLVSICDAEYVDIKCLNTLVSYIYKNKSVSKISGVLKTLETIAIQLNERGITDKNCVENYLNSASKNYIQVFKHLGLSGRIASDIERKYIDKWLYEYKMPLQLILEACDKTMLSINEPSFNYIEKIVATWKDKNIKSVAELKKSSMNTAPTSNTTLSSTASTKKSKFANYNEEKANYDNFEKENTDYLMKKYGR